MIHALNTVYIKELNKWIRLDTRGNKENINAYFSLDEEHLTYTIRSELGEIDYCYNHADLDDRLVNILMQSEDIIGEYNWFWVFIILTSLILEWKTLKKRFLKLNKDKFVKQILTHTHSSKDTEDSDIGI